MGDRPTFFIADDYVALMDLKPAERTVYMLLRCNTSFGRKGVAEHAVHVTASWFTEMTSHWEKPFPASTARRGINGLIDKGVLIRLNEPQDGSGFVLAFVADPRGQIDGPVNGFEHAKRTAKRCGTKVYYERKDGLPGIPSVTGVRLGSRKVPQDVDSWGEQDNESPAAPQDDVPEERQTPAATPAKVPEPRAEEAAERADVTPVMKEFADRLEERTAQFNDPKLRLLTGACQRLAEAARPVLDRGWSPKLLVNRLASELNPRINTPERFLLSKLKDIGDPPKNAPSEAPSVDPDKLDGLREADMRRAPEPQSGPDVGDEVEKELIKRQYQEKRARRTMAGPGFPRKS